MDEQKIVLLANKMIKVKMDDDADRCDLFLTLTEIFDNRELLKSYNYWFLDKLVKEWNWYELNNCIDLIDLTVLMELIQTEGVMVPKDVDGMIGFAEIIVLLYNDGQGK